jgi:hypothetical protein
VRCPGFVGKAEPAAVARSKHQCAPSEYRRAITLATIERSLLRAVEPNDLYNDLYNADLSE